MPFPAFTKTGSLQGPFGSLAFTMNTPWAEKDMTQKVLAEAVGVSRQTINAIEKGEYNPTIKLCCKICRVLDKRLDDLFWEDEEDEN